MFWNVKFASVSVTIVVLVDYQKPISLSLLAFILNLLLYL